MNANGSGTSRLLYVLVGLALVLGLGGAYGAVKQLSAPVEPRSAERAKVLCATETGNCVEAWNGTDIKVYSDAGSTAKFTVAGATGNTTIAGSLSVPNGILLDTVISSGNAYLTGTLKVAGTSLFTDTLTAQGNFVANQGAAITGTLSASGAATLDGGLSVDSPAFTVANTSGNVATGGTLAVTGASTLTGAVTTGGRATVGSIFGLTPSTLAITVTDGATITPVSSFQKLFAAGNVGATMSAGTAGDVVCLWNTSNTTITITDTGSIKLSADAALAQDDVLCTVSDGTNRLEISRSNN